MQRLLSGFAAAAALALLVSAGQACSFHDMQATASLAKPQEGVSMSTYDGANPPPIATEAVDAAAAECAPDATDCVPAGK